MRRTSSARRPAGALAVAALAVLAVAGCAGAEPGEAAEPSATVAPAATTPAATTAAPATPSPAASVVALPESVLRPIQGTTYEPIPGLPPVPPEIAERPEGFSGYVSRAAMREGTRAALVQLGRLVPDIASVEADADEATTYIFEEFIASTEYERRTVEGREFLVADGVRGQPLGTVVWREGTDIIFVSSIDAEWAVRMARAYITGGDV